MKYNIVFFIAFMILSCSTSSKMKHGFVDYYSKINTIQLPLTINCGFNNYETPENIEKPLIDRFSPNNMEIVGRIYENDKNIFILYAAIGDILYPYLYIFDREGNVIDSTYLHNKDSYCGADEYLESNAFTTISQERIITMIDTSRVFIIDTLDQVNPRKLSSTIISFETLKIDKLGKVRSTKKTKKEI